MLCVQGPVLDLSEVSASDLKRYMSAHGASDEAIRGAMRAMRDSGQRE